MRFLRVSIFMALSAALYSNAAQAKQVWYVGLVAGHATVHYDTTLGVSYNRVHDKDFTYALEMGYRPVKYLAMEIAYHRYGHYATTATPHCPPSQSCSQTVNSVTTNLAGWTFLLVPQLPLGYGFSGFLEGGLLHWNMTGLIGSSPNSQHIGNSPLYGAGLRYDFGWPVSLKVSFQHSTINLNETSVGAEWRF